MTVFMFPGQGAQTKGMGEALFAAFPKETALASDILGYDIQALCVQDPEEKLSQTQYTQPALYVVEALSYLQAVQEGNEARICIGHSLGEYSALFAAEVFSFELGLRLVQKRGALMATAENGGMLAVINLAEARIFELLDAAGIQSIDAANKNSPNQLVLSGPKEDILRAHKILEPEAMMCVVLNVSGAFHSRYMRSAADEFSQFLEDVSFNAPQRRVIANANLSDYDAANAKANLVAQIYSPVLWSQTVSMLKQAGESDFREIGPGKVLTRLLRQIS